VAFRAGLATVVACLLGSMVASAAAGASSRGSPKQTLERALTAATKAGSVRITVQFFSGSTTGKVVQDSSQDSGEQTVAIGDERTSVVLLGGQAFISGNRQGMTSYFGLPSSLAPSLAGRWISLQPTDAAFESVTATVSLPAALAEVTPSGPVVAGKQEKVAGQQVRSISGEAPGGAGRLTIFVAATSPSLPVEAVESSRSGETAKGEIVTFSRWGERLNVPTPSPAIPISTLEAASSASGS
jgi:hypothetical protein